MEQLALMVDKNCEGIESRGKAGGYGKNEKLRINEMSRGPSGYFGDI